MALPVLSPTAPWGCPLALTQMDWPLFFSPHLCCVINLQLESMEESARPLCWQINSPAGGQQQPSRPRGQAPPRRWRKKKKKRCLNACCPRPPRSPWLSKEEEASTIFVPAPEYNLFWMKIASLGRFGSNRPSPAPLSSYILHRGLVSLCLLPYPHHTFSASFHKLIRLWAEMS